MHTATHSIVKLPPGTYILSLAQALNLTTAVISVAVAALVGSAIADSPTLGTVPYGAQFASVMVCTYPASMLMRRTGRRPVFAVGGVLLIAAGILGYFAVVQSNFPLLVLAHVLLGSFIACANFYRFAAVDSLPSTIKAKGISLVVAGGVIAAILGPAIAETVRVVPGYAEFSLCYGSLSGAGVLTLVLIGLWKPRAAGPVADVHRTGLAHRPRQLSPAIPAAIAASAGSYFSMNLLMVQASLVMKDLCGFDASSRAIQAHVLAMFAPSFVTGKIIGCIGLRQTLLTGAALISIAAAFGIYRTTYPTILIGLFLLGLGWNFSYVGGGTLLTNHLDESSRHRWQGINDTAIAACATLGAFLPAPLLALAGWKATNVVVVALSVASALFCVWAIKLESTRARQANMHENP